MPEPVLQSAGSPALQSFRGAILRGLGVFLPPLLTIVIFIWVGRTITEYVLEPLERFAAWAIAYEIADIRDGLTITNAREKTAVTADGVFVQVDGKKFIPFHVFDTVHDRRGTQAMPTGAWEIYQAYARIEYLQWYTVVPVFLCVFILILYLLGKFLAAGIGKFFWSSFENVIHRLPLVRSVYSSVKQVTDFMFTEREFKYLRVVAVEYPRKGIWSLAFVTGEGFLDISSAANEPVISLLLPTSPAPFTGFAIVAKRSEVIDLDITFDQALQFIVSCGVVVPPHQLPGAAQKLPVEAAVAQGN